MDRRKYIPHFFNNKKESAGWDWLKGFLTRNPTLSLRTTNEKYFDLSKIMEQINFDRIQKF